MNARGREYIEEEERRDRLQDAAEEMYEALKQVVALAARVQTRGQFKASNLIPDEAVVFMADVARSALAKAEGRAP